MMKIEISDATLNDARFIANNLRDSDIEELIASRPGTLPRHAVMESYIASLWCMVVRVDGNPAILFGLCESSQPNMGIPWLLGTNGALQISRPFVRGCRDWVSRMESSFPFLYNMVHKKNTVSINWLRWLGFHVDSEPIGPDGQFVYFWKGNPNV